MSSDSRTILVVEDEDALRLSMVRGLSKVPGVTVHGAASLGEARVLLRSVKPSLVVSDLDLPDGLGISLAVEMEHIGLRASIVFVSAYVRKFHQRLASGNFEVYEKPISLERLREIALEKIGDGAMAAPSPFGVADFVQLAGMGRHSVVIEANGSEGKGLVLISRGEIWSAEDEIGRGVEAFRRLLRQRRVHVTCRTLEADALPERTMTGTAEGALLDAARCQDEESRDTEGSVDDAFSDMAWEETPGAPAAEETRAKLATLRPAQRRTFEEAFERGVDALLGKDYPQALLAFREASELLPDDRRVMANLARLRDMGFQ